MFAQDDKIEEFKELIRSYEDTGVIKVVEKKHKLNWMSKIATSK